ncbi:MAG: hypothetical protein OQJ80_09955 [Kangiella sp.]|nr:hypothetical protein [Kangiella sp.]
MPLCIPIGIPARPIIPEMSAEDENALSDEAYQTSVFQVNTLKGHIVRLEETMRYHNQLCGQLRENQWNSN